MQFMKKKAKGAAMVEYAILLGAVTLIGILGLSVLGHKTADITGTLAVILPGGHTEDNAAITAAALIETTTDNSSGTDTLVLDSAAIVNGYGTERLFINTGLGAGNAESILIEP